MKELYLKSLYRQLYDKPFDKGQISNLLRMQSAVYLLQNMGLVIDNYKFVYTQNKIHSIILLSDLAMLQGIDEKPPEWIQCCIIVKKDAEEKIKTLRQHIDIWKSTAYTLDLWIECLAMTHYLISRELSEKASNKDINDALKQKNPCFYDTDSNLKAIHVIRELF